MRKYSTIFEAIQEFKNFIKLRQKVLLLDHDVYEVGLGFSLSNSVHNIVFKLVSEAVLICVKVQGETIIAISVYKSQSYTPVTQMSSHCWCQVGESSASNRKD